MPLLELIFKNLMTITTLVTAMMFSNAWAQGIEKVSLDSRMAQIQANRRNQEALAEVIPIVKCPFNPSRYEKILMTQLRDRTTATKDFREAAQKIGSILAAKVVECFPTIVMDIETPLTKFAGEKLIQNIELVSIMRSGDALLDTFMIHFPEASISKILVQRDEETAKAEFIYMKLSQTIASGNPVVITEPMIASGGTLDMVISLLKEKGVLEQNIIIASICTAPEGLLYLNEKHPNIQVVLIVMDEQLNERKYILPGLGDFGDRYFGTTKN
jgi:uracil phosphoribosyltransferase